MVVVKRRFIQHGGHPTRSATVRNSTSASVVAPPPIKVCDEHKLGGASVLGQKLSFADARPRKKPDHTRVFANTAEKAGE